jgi:hypothetical protein
MILKSLSLPALLTITIIAMASQSSCRHKPDISYLRTGDLLFATSHPNADGLDQAINDVTQTSKHTDYTHVGIVEVDDEAVWVIHAAPIKGVTREPIESFLVDQNVVDAYRLVEEYREFIPDAIEKAHALLGLPYDYTYMLGSGGHYCSGFIYTIFEHYGVFDLEPMTFKDPRTGEFHKDWIDHYKEMGIEIPEGQPGCHPNGLAESAVLRFLNRVQESVANKPISFLPFGEY